ncbi:MAG: tetratricopeptide repeat protein, partial [Rhodospirillales bacterium]|nr:tetratricopeptide repeat protein [Rhodospirillales bacterium]
KEWEHLSALGVAYDTQGKYADAQAAYYKALGLSANNPVILNNLGLSLAQEARLDEAIAMFQRAADQPAAASQVRQNLGLLLAFKGDYEAAERMARKDLTPDQLRERLMAYKVVAGLKREGM